jgi:hypothetical protein
VRPAQRMQLRELVGRATGSSAAVRSGSEETMRARRCLDLEAPWSAGAASGRWFVEVSFEVRLIGQSSGQRFVIYARGVRAL